MYQYIHLIYLICSVFFILSLKGLASPKSAVRGNFFGMLGMGIALWASFMNPSFDKYFFVLIPIIAGAFIGTYIAYTISINKLPELIAGFHSLIGLSACLVAFSAFLNPESLNIGLSGKLPPSVLAEMSLGMVIGMITFSSSVIAFGKLANMPFAKNRKFLGQKYLLGLLTILLLVTIVRFVLSGCSWAFLLMSLIAFIIGILLILPIGAADMPVIVSMLNSYSGWATSGIGFTLQNSLLIIVGALVGASGAILSYVMCKAMNRSLLSVIFSPFTDTTSTMADDSKKENEVIKTSSAEDASFILQNSESIIIVPGYGMAVAKAQGAVKELTELLEEKGKSVKFAIHPVAGRMPGHMNVLLAEGNIDYEKVFELEEINNDFANTDVVIVIGANDITNPAAKNNPQSPIYGMPILEVSNAKTVFFIKRSMNAGYAGIENELFYGQNTMMLFGDAKGVVEEILRFLKEG